MADPLASSATQRKGDLPLRPDPAGSSDAAFAQRALLAGLDAIGSAGALLDRHGRLVAANETADTLVGCVLDLADHRLKARCREGEMRLARFQAGLERGVRSFAILPRAAEAPILLRAVPLGLPLGSATTLVTFAAVGEEGLPQETTLREAFDLTATEACVALAIASGRDLRGIARCRGVSVETIRSHLRNVFSKTGTGRQAGLVALIAALPKA